jgi:hypothetical protein
VRYQNTVFGNLLKAVPRRRFAAIVARHGGDKYVKGFSSWDHLVTLVFGQLGGLSSLREVETVWNVQAMHHYHLGSGTTWGAGPPGERAGSLLDPVGRQSATAQRDLRRGLCRA